MTIADELLEFTFSGDPADPIKRHMTGLYSFDHAFETAKGDFGMPIGCGYEVFGAKSVGKSTFCYSLLAHLGNTLNKNVVLSDLEGFDAGHFKNILQYSGYSGDVHLIHQGTDEEILEKFEDAFLKRGDFEIKKEDQIEYGIGMFDSIAAISPAAERKGDLGEANMGRRGFLMAQHTRRLLPTVHPRTIGSENIYFMTNHWYGKLAERGYQSPGGKVKDYLFGVQIHLKRKQLTVDSKKVYGYPDGSYILIGTLYKNRYGFDKTTFEVFVKSGVGIHRGLTAVLDAQSIGKATKKGRVKIGNNGFGYFTSMIKKEWDNEEFFQPFYEVLEDEDD